MVRIALFVTLCAHLVLAQEAEYGAPAYAPSRVVAAPAYGPAKVVAAPAYGPAKVVAAEPVYAPQPYNFGYKVDDGYSNTHFQQEEGDSYGVKRGSYGYTDANGIYRQVDYVADADGFRATIRTNEPGTSNPNPADVVLDASPAPLTAYAVPAKVVAAPAYGPAKVVAAPAYAPAPVVAAPAYEPARVIAEPAYAPAKVVAAPAYEPPRLLAPPAYEPTYEPAKVIAAPAYAPRPAYAPAKVVAAPAYGPARVVAAPAYGPARVVAAPAYEPAPLQAYQPARSYKKAKRAYAIKAYAPAYAGEPEEAASSYVSYVD